MSNLAAIVLLAALRTNFFAFFQKVFHTLNPKAEFYPGWYLEAVSHQLQLCAEGKVRRLIILLPPRSMKSTMVSVAWPAFMLAHRPNMKIITASYSQELANSFSNNTRSVLNAPWYRDAFPNTLISPTKDTQSWFATTQHGGRFSTSVGGAMTGLGADVIIIDDPIGERTESGQ
jgi:hypothetical protein